MALSRKPTDVWSVRERLALASSVMRSGDQNWVSVSRAVKPFGESNRPPEWFCLKNCALQYTDLLEKVETPKRKRSERGELRETPGDVIMRKLTIERIEELKRLVQQEQDTYKWCKKEWEMTRAGEWDNKVKTMYEEIEETRMKEAAAATAAAQKATQDTATKAQATKLLPGKSFAAAAPVKPQKLLEKLIIPVLDFDESTLDSNSGSFVTDDSDMSALSTASTPQLQAELPRPSGRMLTSLLDSHAALEALQAEQNQQLKTRQQLQEMQSHQIDTKEEDIKQEEDNEVDVEDIPKIQIKIEPIEQIKEEPVDVEEVQVDSPVDDILESVVVKQEELSLSEMVETVISPESDIHVEVETEPSEVIAEDSSISSDNEEIKEEEDVEEEEEEGEQGEEEEETETETKATESVQSDVEDLKEEVEATETPEPTPDMKPSSRSAFDFDEPPSPASSVLSNDTDGGSGPSRGRAPSRRGRGGKANFGRRPGRPRKTDDEAEKNESSSKRSEAETSDDEGPNLESDDAVSKPVLPSAESVPNSPASINPSDTEAEKEHKVWKKSIMLVWRSAANHKYANVFLHPVTNEIAPGYRNVVFRPMNLSSVKKNIESGVIRTTSEFQRDMMLMFTNAIMYNSSDHDVYNMAVEMYNDVMVHIEQFMNTQMMVQSEQKVLRASSRTRAETISDKEDEFKKRRMSTEDGGKTKKRKTSI